MKYHNPAGFISAYRRTSFDLASAVPAPFDICVLSEVNCQLSTVNMHTSKSLTNLFRLNDALIKRKDMPSWTKFWTKMFHTGLGVIIFAWHVHWQMLSKIHTVSFIQTMFVTSGTQFIKCQLPSVSSLL